jgi:hypothetical protein
MRCPRLGGTLNFQPDLLRTLKPLVRRSLIANLTPDAFLEIQSRLVRGQILQVQSRMSLDEEVHRVTFMPPGPIHVEPDRVTLKTLIQKCRKPRRNPSRLPCGDRTIPLFPSKGATKVISPPCRRGTLRWDSRGGSITCQEWGSMPHPERRAARSKFTFVFFS